MRIVYCEQGSPEWFQCRAGHITSSVIADVMRKKADAVTRERLKDRLLGEILSGKPDDEKGFSSKHMEAGKEREPFARTAYELRENVMVETVGFVYHPTIPRCGTSPDSMVGDDGVLEIKCPLRATHLRYIREDRIPPEYMKQCIWHLVCTRRKWLDFVSYHPGPTGTPATLRQAYRGRRRSCGDVRERGSTVLG
jgi:putative phage-type endonuclease